LGGGKTNFQKERKVGGQGTPLKYYNLIIPFPPNNEKEEK
jgi:hypothetical protein